MKAKLHERQKKSIMAVSKKIISLLLTGVLLTAGTMTQAQTSTSDKAYLLNLHNISTDKSAIRATRDFWQRTGEQNDAQWYKDAEGYLAEYSVGSTKSQFFYDRNGNFRFSILTYTEKEMPADVRHLVRSNYYDFSIGWVKEVDEAQTTAYVVHIEDTSSWKDVVVQDGEMRVLHAFRKQ